MGKIVSGEGVSQKPRPYCLYQPECFASFSYGEPNLPDGSVQVVKKGEWHIYLKPELPLDCEVRNGP
jgi:hypothetical protein